MRPFRCGIEPPAAAATAALNRHFFVGGRATSISASYTIRKSGPSVPARRPCGQDGTRPTVADPPATAVAVAAARALDARRADQLSAARRAPALTELQRSDLV